MAWRLDRRIRLKDGRIASVSFLSKRDSAAELQRYINSFLAEGAYLLHDRKYSLKEEREWKRNSLKTMRKGEYYHIIARVDGKIAGTTDARRGRLKERGNVSLGIAIAKPYRGIGLGEAMLGLNIETARRLMKPRNIWLCAFAPNKPALSLYKKLGFRKFAIYPKWLLHKGRYLDDVCLILDR
jgi:RimJ/RimL family protein N-acetyltransferase